MTQPILPPDEDFRQRAIAYIERRDHVSTSRARQALAALTPQAMGLLDMEMNAHRPASYTADYDPYARG